MTKCLCLDPSTTSIGWALVEKTPTGPKLIDSGFFKPKGKTAYERIQNIGTWLSKFPNGDHLSEVAIEDTVHGYYPTGKISAVMGALDYVIHSLFYPNIVRYSPSEIKLAATGKGNANKAKVIECVARLWGLYELPQEDQADALAIAYMWGNS